MVNCMTRKQLALPRELITQLAQEFKCNQKTIKRALNLTSPTTGERPDRIRVRAKELGAQIEIKKIFFKQS